MDNTLRNILTCHVRTCILRPQTGTNCVIAVTDPSLTLPSNSILKSPRKATVYCFDLIESFSRISFGKVIFVSAKKAFSTAILVSIFSVTHIIPYYM